MSDKLQRVVGTSAIILLMLAGVVYAAFNWQGEKRIIYCTGNLIFIAWASRRLISVLKSN